MKKNYREINLLDLSQTEHKSIRAHKVKTTNINILLNRVRLTKKNEIKNKIISSSFLLLILVIVSFFSLI